MKWLLKWNYRKGVSSGEKLKWTIGKTVRDGSFKLRVIGYRGLHGESKMVGGDNE